jgi:nondiscriminating glutamyl-tRNA synthetase
VTQTRDRIAPSPTGPLHIGTARTALFNYLYAKRTGGTFVLRLEDTDVARSTIAFEEDILGGLHWLGIQWDEGPDAAGGADRGPYAPYRQLQRMTAHQAAAADLLARDLAYPCYCTPAELDADRKTAPPGRRPASAARCGSAFPRASSPGRTSSAAGSRSTPPTSAGTSSSSGAMGRRCTTSPSWSTTRTWR